MFKIKTGPKYYRFKGFSHLMDVQSCKNSVNGTFRLDGYRTGRSKGNAGKDIVASVLDLLGVALRISRSASIRSVDVSGINMCAM